LCFEKCQAYDYGNFSTSLFELFGNFRYYSEQDEADQLFGKINKIFKETGCPTYPLMLTPVFLVVLLPMIWFEVVPHKNPEDKDDVEYFFTTRAVIETVIFILVTVCMAVGPTLYLENRRKKLINRALKEENEIWLKRGLYFALGGELGQSNENFWDAISTQLLSIRWKRSRTGYDVLSQRLASLQAINIKIVIIMFFSPHLHLYLIIDIRKQFCFDYGMEDDTLPILRRSIPLFSEERFAASYQNM